MVHCVSSLSKSPLSKSPLLESEETGNIDYIR
jgi:hypothetical protein